MPLTSRNELEQATLYHVGKTLHLLHPQKLLKFAWHLCRLESDSVTGKYLVCIQLSRQQAFARQTIYFLNNNVAYAYELFMKRILLYSVRHAYTSL